MRRYGGMLQCSMQPLELTAISETPPGLPSRCLRVSKTAPNRNDSLRLANPPHCHHGSKGDAATNRAEGWSDTFRWRCDAHTFRPSSYRRQNATTVLPGSSRGVRRYTLAEHDTSSI